MKLHKLLQVNGQTLRMTENNVQLSLFRAGRGLFTVQSTEPVNGLVRLFIGFEGSALLPFFVGFVESSTTVDARQQRILCKEFTAAFDQVLPVSLRGVSLVDLLHHVSGISSAPFSPADADYSRAPCSAVHHAGMGFHLLDSLGHVFRIPQYIWQQQADGSIYVGSWQHSPFAGHELHIPDKFFTAGAATRHSTLPALPKLRPGVLVNDLYITELEMSNAQMHIERHPDPWRSRRSYGG